MGFLLERNAAVLKRMLPPDNMAIRGLSQAEGISEATLHKWRLRRVARGSFYLTPKQAPRAGLVRQVCGGFGNSGAERSRSSRILPQARSLPITDRSMAGRLRTGL